MTDFHVHGKSKETNCNFDVREIQFFPETECRKKQIVIGTIQFFHKTAKSNKTKCNLDVRRNSIFFVTVSYGKNNTQVIMQEN